MSAGFLRLQLPSPPPIEDVLPPIAQPGLPGWILPAILLATAVAALLAYLRFRSRPAPPEPTPSELAKQAINALESEADSTDPHDFGVALSEIVRTYLHDAYRLPATRQTTQEFLDGIENDTRFDTATRNRCREFLRWADQAKFAPPAERAHNNRGMLERARSLVTKGGDGQ